jgi:hypothetical protein
MPTEEVLTLPLETDEIIAVVLQRIEARLRSNCHFSGAATYNGFSVAVEIKFQLNDVNFGKKTLVWDQFSQGEAVPASAPVETITEDYVSGDSPNAVRQDHDLGIPVKVTEGRKTTIKKIKIPKKGKAA